jgi:hypothetical protein
MKFNFTVKAAKANRFVFTFASVRWVKYSTQGSAHFLAQSKTRRTDLFGERRLRFLTVRASSVVRIGRIDRSELVAALGTIPERQNLLTDRISRGCASEP